MKPGEVNALSDEELRIKAAELDGWEDVRVAPELCGHMVGRHPKFKAVKGDGFDLVPDYPNDIAAAWTLHENQCALIFSRRKRYLDALSSLLREGHLLGIGSLVAWPDALLFLTPSNITRAFIVAMSEEE